jgi:hypothetical protein
MPPLSRITTRRWQWINKVCSSWDGPSLIIRTILKKPNPHWLPFLRPLACRRQRRLPAGYAGPAIVTACEKRGIEPYIATGRDPHHASWQQRFAPLSDPLPEEASSQAKMAYKLRTALGKAISGARKYTVEPVIGIIKEV